MYVMAKRRAVGKPLKPGNLGRGLRRLDLDTETQRNATQRSNHGVMQMGQLPPSGSYLLVLRLKL
jgi:hypothetical protein